MPGDETDNGEGAVWPSAPHQIPSEPSLTSALERLFDASQRVITKRIDLAFLEVSDALTRTVRGALLVSIAIGVVWCGWWALMALIVFLLDDLVSLPVRLAIVAALSVGAGVLLLALGAAQIRRQPLVASAHASKRPEEEPVTAPPVHEPGVLGVARG